MTHLRTHMCHAESSACPSKRETSSTSLARTTPTGGRRTGKVMRTRSPSLASFLVSVWLEQLVWDRYNKDMHVNPIKNKNYVLLLPNKATYQIFIMYLQWLSFFLCLNTYSVISALFYYYLCTIILLLVFIISIY